MLSFSNEIASTARDTRQSWQSSRPTTVPLRSDRSLPTRENGIQETRIRVLLADADPVATSTVRARLRAHPDFEVIAETSSGEDTIQRILSLRPDAVLVDVGIVESSGLDVAELLCLPIKPILVFLTEHA